MMKTHFTNNLQCFHIGNNISSWLEPFFLLPIAHLEHLINISQAQFVGAQKLVPLIL